MNPNESRFSVVYFDAIPGCLCVKCSNVTRPKKAVSAYAAADAAICDSHNAKIRAIEETYKQAVKEASETRLKAIYQVDHDTREAMKTLELLKKFL